MVTVWLSMLMSKLVWLLMASDFKSHFDQVNEFLQQQNPSNALMDAYQVAMGFVQVANEAMCRPIRALTQVSH